MSKSLIVLMVGMLVVGCGKQEKAAEPLCLFHNESTPTINTNEVDGTTVKPDKELTLREKAIGAYETKEDGFTFRVVLLDNGILEFYNNGNKTRENKWTIINGEIHVEVEDGFISVSRINLDGSITIVAGIDKEGKRINFSKEDQSTAKKSNNPNRKLT